MKNTSIFHTLLPLLLPALPLLIILASCHKDLNRKVIIQGKVTEYGTGLPIANARIYVLCFDGQIFGGYASSLADSILTDAEGRFYREYEDSELCNGVYLIPYKEGYFKGSEIDLTTKNEAHEVVLDPEAWVKVVTVPDGGIQHLFVGGDFLGSAGYDVYSNDGTQERLFQNRGNRNKIIRWRPWGEMDHTVQDTIFLWAHDTTTYTIHY